MDSGFTPKTQELLIFGLKNGYISYRSQKVFESKNYYPAVKFLLETKLIYRACCVCEDPLEGEQNLVCSKTDRQHKERENKVSGYLLTPTGKMLAFNLRDVFFPQKSQGHFLNSWI